MRRRTRGGAASRFSLDVKEPRRDPQRACGWSKAIALKDLSAAAQPSDNPDCKSRRESLPCLS